MSPAINVVVGERGPISMEQPIKGGASITVKIVEDSITEDGSRLITWCWEYWRGIHEEIMTHRALSRNSASSRAIPTARMRQWIDERPAVPVHFGKNEKGMQATTEIDDVGIARDWWLKGRDLMLAHHKLGEELGLHKQVVNRVIQPWMTIAVVVSMTDHANIFHLRKHHMAEPNFQVIANLAWELFHNHMPTYVPIGGWHLPYIEETEEQLRRDLLALPMADYAVPRVAGYSTLNAAVALSTARCARVSYLTHEGARDLVADFMLHKRLVVRENMESDPIHASPAEHPAQAVGGRARHGNFEGWKSYRKFLPFEAGPDTDERCGNCGCWGGRHVKGCSAA